MKAVNHRLSREEVRTIDRRAVEVYGIPEIVLMENAGRGAAERILEKWRGLGRHVIVCGGGNNGGDGFVIARHMALRGVDTTVLLACEPARLPRAAATNHAIVKRMNVPMLPFLAPHKREAHRSLLSGAAVIVDALLGTGFSGTMRPPLDDVIHAINASTAHVAAADLPSGLDCDTGLPGDPCVSADLTITFVAPKIGFDNPAAAAYLGEVCVADIGAPA